MLNTVGRGRGRRPGCQAKSLIKWEGPRREGVSRPQGAPSSPFGVDYFSLWQPFLPCGLCSEHPGPQASNRTVKGDRKVI